MIRDFRVIFYAFLYGKRHPLSCLFPAVFASLTAAVMYVGELVLTDGELFRFVGGFMFTAIWTLPFALIDYILIIIWYSDNNKRNREGNERKP